MLRAYQQLSYVEVWYVLFKARGCGVKIADPLDRVTARLHLFRHSTGPPDEPDQPTPDAQAIGLCPNARAEEKRHIHLFIIRAELQVQMMQSSLKDSIEHMQSGPFKPSFIITWPCHQLNPAWKMESISSSLNPTVDKAVQRCWKSLASRSCNSDVLILGCPYAAIPSKWVQARCLYFYVHGVLQKESILEHHLSSPNK